MKQHLVCKSLYSAIQQGPSLIKIQLTNTINENMINRIKTSSICRRIKFEREELSQETIHTCYDNLLAKSFESILIIFVDFLYQFMLYCTYCFTNLLQSVFLWCDCFKYLQIRSTTRTHTVTFYSYIHE